MEVKAREDVPQQRRLLALVFLWGLVLAQIGNLIRHAWLRADTGHLPGWDLKVYRAAAQVLAEGHSPYGPGALMSQGSFLPYTYSPLLKWTLPPFLGDAATVRTGYVAAEILFLLLAVVVLVWGLGLQGWRAAAGAWIVVGGGLSGLNLDFQAGNITAFEMLPATIFLVGVWRRQPLISALGMTALCVAKPTWILLALLPLLRDFDRSGLKRMVLSGVAGLTPLLLSFVLFPGDTRTWLGDASRLRESFNINPCLREFIANVFSVLHLPASDLVWIPISLGLTFWLLHLRRNSPEGLSAAIMVTFALFAPLIFPRMKPYSYAILGMIVALLLTYDARTLRQLALPMVLVSFPYLVSYDHDTVFLMQSANGHHIPAGGWPMLLTSIAGLLIVRWILRERKGGERAVPTARDERGARVIIRYARLPPHRRNRLRFDDH